MKHVQIDPSILPHLELYEIEESDPQGLLFEEGLCLVRVRHMDGSFTCLTHNPLRKGPRVETLGDHTRDVEERRGVRGWLDRRRSKRVR